MTHSSSTTGMGMGGSVTYPTEMLPVPDYGDEVEVIIASDSEWADTLAYLLLMDVADAEENPDEVQRARREIAEMYKALGILKAVEVSSTARDWLNYEHEKLQIKLNMEST